jgi:cytochrome d ubiquinol oxidase subunit I
MGEDALAVTLARAQFAFTVSFHFLLPAFTIGLASYLAVLEGLWLVTGKPVFLSLFRYWLKVFAIAFAMGVVSGIVLSYELGANWSGYADRVGPIIGPLMAYEVMTAFFLEAGFLGVMLFGLGRLPTPVHFASTLAVAAGTLMSAFWILSANSWMQTPAGYAFNPQGQFVPLNWTKIIFNPSFPFRLTHTVLAAYLTTALAVGAVGAWHLLRDPAHGGARVMFAMAMGMVALTAPLQIWAGDAHGLNTLHYQPAKVMAMEGHFESSSSGAPLALFGLPNMKAGRLDAAVLVPKASSLILKHDPNAPLAGLDTIARENWPPAPIVFWSFRVMVGLGLLMLALGLAAVWAMARRKLYEWPSLHRFALAMGPAGFVAVIAGWITTEVGRQPFTVYGQLRTFHSASPLDAPAVAASLVAFVLVYAVVFGIGGLYMLKLVSHAPALDEPGLAEGPGRPQRAAGITPAPAVRPDEVLGSGADHGA